MLVEHSAGIEEVSDVKGKGQNVSVPLEVQQRRAQKESDPEAIEKREDAERTTFVKSAEVVVALQRVEKDSGDEEARKDEEEIDTDPSPTPDGSVGEHWCVVHQKHHEERNGTQSVEGRIEGADETRGGAAR